MARILVVGPHPDDQELGMGGTVIKLMNQGHDVLILDVTNGEPTPLGSPEIRKQEAADAFKVLSRNATGEVDRWLLDLPNRFVEHTIENRHALAGVIRAWQAEMIFTTFDIDAHPDHRAVTRCVEDARFDAKLSKIEMPKPTDAWTGRTFELGDPLYPKWLFYYYATHLRWVADPSFVFDISGAVEQKLESIRAYHTQFVLPPKNARIAEWVEHAASYFGSRIGTEAGEPFFTKEPVGLGDLASLVGV
jgi:N-acetylglucosamine malate deacetylase 1|tara:strand:+ start:109651 stop:110394 length:744 start_codon:yes stop_codon:yes gene_type:complete